MQYLGRVSRGASYKHARLLARPPVALKLGSEDSQLSGAYTIQVLL